MRVPAGGRLESAAEVRIVIRPIRRVALVTKPEVAGEGCAGFQRYRIAGLRIVQRSLKIAARGMLIVRPVGGTYEVSMNTCGRAGIVCASAGRGA
jgi:hypothetical protein